MRTTCLYFNEKPYDLMAEHVRSQYPYEACGALLGTEDKVVMTVPFENTRAKNERRSGYDIDPRELYDAEKYAVKAGLDIIGFYHSHPDSKAIPSQEDIKEMLPGLIYVINAVFKEAIKDTRGYYINEVGEQINECVCFINS